MIRSGTIQRRLWWASVLFLVLTFLGHDVLMASDVHAARRTSHHAIEHPPGTSQSGLGAGGKHHHEPASNHTDVCGAARVVVRPAAPNTDTDPPALPSTISIAAVPERQFTSTVHLNWTEPTVPADTRRALFQVYRN